MMRYNEKYNRIIRIVNNISKREYISKNITFKILELEFSDFLKQKYYNILTFINKKSGIITCFYKSNNILKTLFTCLNFLNRISIKIIKSAFKNRITKIKKRKVFYITRNKIGKTISGKIEKIINYAVIVRMGIVTALLKKNIFNMDFYKIGNEINAYIIKIDMNNKYPIILSNMKDILDQSVLCNLFYPFHIKCHTFYHNVAKIAFVYTNCNIHNNHLYEYIAKHPSGISRLLLNKKIEIVKWDCNINIFIINSMIGLDIKKITFHNHQKYYVIIDNIEYNLITIKNRENIKAVIRLIGRKIIFLNITELKILTKRIFLKVFYHLRSSLNIQDILADLLITQGYISLNIISSLHFTSLLEIEEINKDMALEIIYRANRIIK